MNKKLEPLFNMLRKVENEKKEHPIVDSGSCIDCDWDGLLKDCDVEYEWDEFKMMDVPYPLCPECGGGIDDYYPSSIMEDEDE